MGNSARSAIATIAERRDIVSLALHALSPGVQVSYRFANSPGYGVTLGETAEAALDSAKHRTAGRPQFPDGMIAPGSQPKNEVDIELAILTGEIDMDKTDFSDKALNDFLASGRVKSMHLVQTGDGAAWSLRMNWAPGHTGPVAFAAPIDAPGAAYRKLLDWYEGLAVKSAEEKRQPEADPAPSIDDLI